MDKICNHTPLVGLLQISEVDHMAGLLPQVDELQLGLLLRRKGGTDHILGRKAGPHSRYGQNQLRPDRCMVYLNFWNRYDTPPA